MWVKGSIKETKNHWNTRWNRFKTSVLSLQAKQRDEKGEYPTLFLKKRRQREKLEKPGQYSTVFYGTLKATPTYKGKQF